MTISPDEQRRLDAAEAELRQQFPAIPPQRLHERFAAEVNSFDAARVREFVPLLVQRGVRKQLQAIESTGPLAAV